MMESKALNEVVVTHEAKLMWKIDFHILITVNLRSFPHGPKGLARSEQVNFSHHVELVLIINYR